MDIVWIILCNIRRASTVYLPCIQPSSIPTKFRSTEDAIHSCFKVEEDTAFLLPEILADLGLRMCAGVVVGISPVAAPSPAAATIVVAVVIATTSGEGGASADRRQADERVVVALHRTAFVRFIHLEFPSTFQQIAPCMVAHRRWCILRSRYRPHPCRTCCMKWTGVNFAKKKRMLCVQD